MSLVNEQLREEGNEQKNQNIPQHHFYQSTQLPSDYTGLVTRVEVNDKGGWIRYSLDQFHFIDGINTSKG